MLKTEEKIQDICLVRVCLRKSMPPSRQMGFPHFFPNWPIRLAQVYLETSVCLIAPSKNGLCCTVIGHSNVCQVAYVIGFKHVNAPTKSESGGFKFSAISKSPSYLLSRKFHSNPKSFKQESFRINIIIYNKLFNYLFT